MKDLLKGALFSKTVWFNGGVGLLGAIDWATNNAPVISSFFPGSGPLLVVLAAVGTILRVVTNEPLAEKA